MSLASTIVWFLPLVEIQNSFQLGTLLVLNILVTTHLISRFLFIMRQTRVFPRMSIMASTVITAVMTRPVAMTEERL